MTGRAATPVLLSIQPETGRFELALMIKLTFDVDQRGQCRPSDEQLPLIAEPRPWEEVEPPAVSPPAWDCDLLSFKPGTDVVVQGHAHSYRGPAKMVEVQVEVPENKKRVIRVYGERRIEWAGASPRFTPPEPFERMPIRFDRAYGGFDPAIEPHETDWALDLLSQADESRQWQTAGRQYYPRNPAGVGFVESLDRGNSDALRVPNLEFAFDPVTPDRLAVGRAEHWMKAPLPAAYDWCDADWFPRIAYLGLTPDHVVPDDGVPEIRLNIASPKLLETTPVTHGGFHPTFMHGASPCMVRRRLAPGTRMRFTNLFADQADQRIALPIQVPRATIEITPSNRVEAESFLSTVAVLADSRKLVQVWSARAQVARPYYPNEIREMKWTITWK